MVEDTLLLGSIHVCEGGGLEEELLFANQNVKSPNEAGSYMSGGTAGVEIRCSLMNSANFPQTLPKTTLHLRRNSSRGGMSEKPCFYMRGNIADTANPSTAGG